MRWGLVDRIDALTLGEDATGVRTFPPDLPLFQDHSPEFPVVPGVLILESLAQLSGKLIGYTVRLERGDWPWPILSMMEKVKFRRFIRPGQEVQLESRFIMLREDSAVMKVRARIDGKVYAQAEQFFVFNAIPLDDPALRAGVEAHEKAELMRLWTDCPENRQ